MLNEEHQTNESSTPIDIGTCGLYTISRSLQMGAKTKIGT